MTEENIITIVFVIILHVGSVEKNGVVLIVKFQDIIVLLKDAIIGVALSVWMEKNVLNITQAFLLLVLMSNLPNDDLHRPLAFRQHYPQEIPIY